MIGALVFANPGRPVAARRRRSRSRTARTTGKEIRMARTRTRRRAGRRTARRNAKGHFMKGSRTTRRSRRRNPSGFIKVGRKWRKITKFAKRRRRGAKRGQIRSFSFPKRYRRSRRRVHRNPVVVSNPGRSRRRRSSGRSRSRRVYRNPGARSFRLASDPIGAIKNAIMSAFSVDTLETLAHMGVGFGGSLWLGKLLYSQPWVPASVDSAPYVKIGSTFVSTLALTGLSSLLKKPALTARVLTGGLFATLWQALSQAVSGTQMAQFVPTLSGSDNDEFRKAIEAEVLKELKGGGVHGYLPAAGAEGYETYLRPAGIEYLRPAGAEAYLTEVGSERTRSGMGAFLTERNTVSADAGVGHDDGDEFSRRGMPERF